MKQKLAILTIAAVAANVPIEGDTIYFHRLDNGIIIVDKLSEELNALQRHLSVRSYNQQPHNLEELELEVSASAAVTSAQRT